MALAVPPVFVTEAASSPGVTFLTVTDLLAEALVVFLRLDIDVVAAAVVVAVVEGVEVDDGVDGLGVVVREERRAEIVGRCPWLEPPGPCLSFIDCCVEQPRELGIEFIGRRSA